MKKSTFIVFFLLLISSFSWGASFFQIELASNVSPSGDDISSPDAADTGNYHFQVFDGTDSVFMNLKEGKSIGLYIGSEFSLDFNMKIGFELGFHGGSYKIDKYSHYVDATSTTTPYPSSENWAINHYLIIAGMRIKWDFQVTDSVSIEPYMAFGIAPVYMFSPSEGLKNRLDAQLALGGDNYTFNQSDILDLTVIAAGVDFDFTRSSVEYTGSSKFLVGFSLRRFKRTVEFNNSQAKPVMLLLCLSGTVLF